MKTLSEHLREVSKGKSGACWMEDFEPQIVEAVKNWLDEHRKAATESLHQNTPDAPANFFIIPCITFIDRTLKPSLESQYTEAKP